MFARTFVKKIFKNDEDTIKIIIIKIVDRMRLLSSSARFLASSKTSLKKLKILELCVV